MTPPPPGIWFHSTTARRASAQGHSSMLLNPVDTSIFTSEQMCPDGQFLLEVCSSCSFRHTVIFWFSSYCPEHATASFEGSFVSLHPLNIDVPSGSVLGHLLFLLHTLFPQKSHPLHMFLSSMRISSELMSLFEISPEHQKSSHSLSSISLMAQSQPVPD